MKLLLKLSIGLITLVILAITFLLIFVDPNDYKSEIETQVKNNLNRDLNINGDIGWTFYPQLGFSSGEIKLDNLSGFNQPHLLKIANASLGINILPLLTGEISIGKLTLDGFELTLLTDKNGLSNLDNMGAENTQAIEVAESQPETLSQENDTPFLAINKTELAGIDINNAIVILEDAKAGSYQKITINEIKLGQFAFDKETELAINTTVIIDDLQAEIKLNSSLLVKSDLSRVRLTKLQIDTKVTGNALPNGELKSVLKTEVDFAVNSKIITLNDFDINTLISADNLPNKKINTQFNAAIRYQVNSQLATIKNLKLKVDNIELAGEVSVQTTDDTKVRYNLVGNEWDLNYYLSKSEDKEEKTPETPPSTESEEEVEPDLSFLQGLDIDGTLKIAGVTIDNIKIGEIKKHLIINAGKAQLKPLTVELYQGLLTLNTDIDGNKGKNKYQVSANLENVQIHPLLVDAIALDIISGGTALTFKGQGQGLTPTKIKQNLDGKGSFKLLDGELYGVNIPQEIRILKAKLTAEEAPTSDNIKKTDFASLTGDFTINEGLVNNQKLLMLSPVMRLDGSGLIHIIKETLNYKLSISPLSSSKANTNYVDLTGLTIPMIIEGSFSDPKISLDTDSALKTQLQEKTKALQKEATAKAKALQKEATAKAKAKLDAELKKQQDKLSTEAQEKLEKGLGDSLKNFF